VTAPLLDIAGLGVTFATSRGTVQALRGVDLAIPRGRIIGIVGESGSGKSTLALAILNLLPANTIERKGSIALDGQNLFDLPQAELRHFRGDRIAMIFQDPMSSLNPVFSIGTHLIDAQKAKNGSVGRAEMRRRAVAMMRKVGIPDAERRLGAYPHQFSGGMRQRIMIAMALLAEPDLLIADEPTTALDVTIEAQIVRLIQQLRADFQGSIIFISHSLGLISELCDDVIVMYAGTVVEAAPATELFTNPRHPYTRALLDCELSTGGSEKRLRSIAGEVPNLITVPPGCIFAPRCPVRVERCTSENPRLRECGPAHRAACWLA
jgi:oligopeptide/dipeptide ABC transporter ATP-binding protein